MSSFKDKHHTPDKMTFKRAKKFPESTQSRESWKLHQANNPYICPYVFSGPTINPDGRLLACCHAADNRDSMGHISDVENLNDWYNTGLLKNQREIMHSGMWTPIPCASCVSRKNLKRTPYAHMDAISLPFDGQNLEQAKSVRKTIRYLEYTPSNLCNQTCVTCGGVFSSLWWSIDKIAMEQDKLQFRYEKNNARTRQLNESTQGVYKLEEKDWEKIEQCVFEGVWKLYMKGGEPFADERNIEFIEKISKNEFPELRQLQLSTNMARMTPRIIRLLEDIQNNTSCGIGMSISIDGIGKQYEWIRSTSWDRLIENIRKVPLDHMSTSITMSPYNFFNIPEIVHTLHNELPKKPSRVGGRPVHNPVYLNCAKVIPEDIYRKVQRERKELQFGRPLDVLDWSWWTEGQGQIHEKYQGEIVDQYKEFTEFMNERRGFRIEDHVPELSCIDK